MNSTAPRRQWLAIGLVASLALNAFFIGAAATGMLRAGAPPDHDRRGGVLRYELRWLAKRLPADAVEKVEAAIADGRVDARHHVERLRVLRSEFGGLVAAADPDRDAIAAKLAEIRVELDAMVREAQTATADTLLALPPATRARLAGD
jgi:hypothetical protein